MTASWDSSGVIKLFGLQLGERIQLVAAAMAPGVDEGGYQACKYTLCLLSSTMTPARGRKS